MTEPIELSGGIEPSDAAGVREARRLLVAGVVQGVGFRPYIFALAARHNLTGWVRNTSAGVEIHVEGAEARIDAFVAALPREAPPRALVASLQESPAEVEGREGFAIVASEAAAGAYQLVPPDLAMCSACRAELLDPSERRFGYAFTNCTDCGPRFTIIEGLPYDRAETTMRDFRLCPQCRREYEDPGDRRFHAEPIACPVCGPRLRLLGSGGEPVAAGRGDVTPDDGAVLAAAVELLLGGEILAIKGLGGFHLACLADDSGAVWLLRERKRRPHKPLAVMVADLAAAEALCHVSTEAAALLQSPESPIVLLPLRETAAGAGEVDDPGAASVVAEVTMGLSQLGVMLPYTPLHQLLCAAVGRPLVMTSGNRGGEPLAAELDEAAGLEGIAAAFLVHNRPIAHRIDDSLATLERGRVRLLRRARGYAPLPITLPRELPQVLGCGAEVKSAFCLTRDRHAFLGHHIGDLENLETLEHFEASVAWHEKLFAIVPEALAYDPHPEYLASKYALGRGAARLIPVQHHHAHIVAQMIEHGRQAPVIGVSLDGLGYGDDGLLWGGEFLICDLLGYRRAAHLEALPLPGGAAAIRAPWRAALGWALATGGEERLAVVQALLARGDEEAAAVRTQVEHGLNAPLTTSCGRLFDVVAVLAGAYPEVSYEGQDAVVLEELAEKAGGVAAARRATPYPIAIDGDLEAAAAAELRSAASYLAPDAERGPVAASVNLGDLIAEVVADRLGGVWPGEIGVRLHATLAALVVDLCRRLRAVSGIDTVVLSGGVFQNRLLSALCEQQLGEDGFVVLASGLVPCNDGGLALGQAAVGGYTLLSERGGFARDKR